MTRLAKLSPDAWDPELREVFDADAATVLEQGAMRVYAHRPQAAKAMIALGAALQRNGTLPPRLKELVRLRIAFHNQCRSCLAIRYREAQVDGVDEALVCSLEKPHEAPDLTAAEREALAYADRFATDHLSIDDAAIDRLRAFYDEGEIVELASWIAFCVGFGRLGAVLDMVEDLPEPFRARDAGPITPWSGTPVVVR